MAEPDRSAGRSRGTLVVLVALTVVAVALVAAGAFLGLRVTRQDVQEARRDAVLQVARTVAADLTTIDHRTADRDVQELLDRSTTQFADSFGISSDSFTEVVRQTQLVSTGEVTSAGVVELDDTTARALVAVRALVRDTTNPDGGPRNYRFGVDLVRQDDRWLVSQVVFL